MATGPRTAGTDCSVRILPWLVPFPFCNIWILARLVAARGRGRLPAARPPAAPGLPVPVPPDAASVRPAGSPGGRPPD